MQVSLSGMEIRVGPCMHLAVGVEAIGHVLVFVEVSGRLGLLAPAALLGSGSPLLQGWQALPSVGSVMREASLAVVIQPIPVGLVSVEVCSCFVGAASPAHLPLHRRILQAETEPADIASPVAIRSPMPSCKDKHCKVATKSIASLVKRISSPRLVLFVSVL